MLAPYTVARYGLYFAIAVAVLSVWLGQQAGASLDYSLLRAVFVFLLFAIIAIFVLSFALALKPGDGEEGFTGTDSVVTETLEQEGTEPWFQPIFEPGSGEIESACRVHHIPPGV